MSVLQDISCSSDLKGLDQTKLNTLADELREQILTVVSKNGGHLSSNLGIVETTIALHRAFDFSKDRIIFDVGHQCYAHKLLSDRKEQFHTIRKDGGLSGFPDNSESVYDAFGAGHAGTSISAGLGFCNARDKLEQDHYVVCVVGDGALFNGLNLEALSAFDKKPKRFIVVLNDNGMSISKNDNGLYKLLSKSTTRGSYVKSKRALRRILGNSFITRFLFAIKEFVKKIVGKNNVFEDFGFKYVGVVDGNDIKKLNKIIGRVKALAKDRPVLLHVKTTKGKGYDKAEEQAETYHGVGANLESNAGNFSVALGEKLNELIKKDKSVIAITAGMSEGTGLSAVKNQNQNNFVDVGIAESFGVTYSAGLASAGAKPFVAMYSTFLQRAYDQILHDVCIQNLPVVFCVDRAGLVGCDGKTHQGVFDLSYATHIPNLNVLAPSCCGELKDMLDYAYELGKPTIIRYPRDSVKERQVLSIKKSLWEVIKTGKDATILAIGPRMLELAIACAEKHQNVGVINARSIKPLCEKTLLEIKDTKIITLEENSLIGGFGSLVRGFYAEKGVCAKVFNLGVKDEFVAHGSVDKQLQENGLTVEEIEKILG